MSDTIVVVVLAAYRQALVDLADVVEDTDALLDHLGEVNGQVSDLRIEVRFGLAGRLLAASHLARALTYSDAELRALIGGWLARRRAELEDAAPSRERVRVEDDVVDNLDVLIREEAELTDPAGAYELAAALILELMERPAMDVEQSLALQGELAELAEDALAIVERPTPHGLSSMFFEERLGVLYLRTRPNGPTPKELLRAEDPWTGWLWIAATASAVHAEWGGRELEESMQRGIALATERLAQGRVPDEPERFSTEGALVHARDITVDAALARLARLLRPDDAFEIEAEPEAREQLLEVAASGLIGAWVTRRRTG